MLVSDITAQHTLQRELGRKNSIKLFRRDGCETSTSDTYSFSSTILYVDQLSKDIDPQKRERICSALKAQLSQTESLITSMLGFVRGGSLLCLEPANVKSIVEAALSSSQGALNTSGALLNTNKINPT